MSPPHQAEAAKWFPRGGGGLGTQVPGLLLTRRQVAALAACDSANSLVPGLHKDLSAHALKVCVCETG